MLVWGPPFTRTNPQSEAAEPKGLPLDMCPHPQVGCKKAAGCLFPGHIHSAVHFSLAAGGSPRKMSSISGLPDGQPGQLQVVHVAARLFCRRGGGQGGGRSLWC